MHSVSGESEAGKRRRECVPVLIAQGCGGSQTYFDNGSVVSKALFEFGGDDRMPDEKGEEGDE